jgi:hypothetical protein
LPERRPFCRTLPAAHAQLARILAAARINAMDIALGLLGVPQHHDLARWHCSADPWQTEFQAALCVQWNSMPSLPA